MAETARFIAMIRASASQNANVDKSKDRDQSSYRPIREGPAAARKPTSALLLGELIHSIKNGAPLPNKPLNTETKEGLDRILDLLNNSLLQTPTATPVTHLSKHKSTFKDIDCVTSTRKLNTTEITTPLHATTMANRFPALSTSDLPRASAEEQSATASPARGTAMLNSIFKSVRVPEFRFKWLFWAEKGQAGAPASKAGAEDFASRPKPLGDTIISVKEFYQHFNNIPVENLKLRDSIHLFHLGVKPVWEDPRNVKGGAWYFKVSKDVASQFWHEMCLLAVGDILQGAVETKRVSFNDDICGISYSVRWNAVQIAVWNRDADNEAGKEKLLAVILEKLSEELKPKKEDNYWYKAHREHKGFIEQ
ncbi:hypothetical protein IAQ61_005702 [Plenodomus lingam]|uniref:Similar to eukaryotic translation initiation factor 4E type 3-A n=1 Tax=Leptosphaeria maculans (strain JN3 / isolate v23.1.3 / race Av1-4-5-6-7-8) TaxID=985895 RepID=E4ZYY7_LEPMJ|nr:similar to eukaryotic translation initiation factor 4E type 3-A [Plenodomus lingam JN3]KAH9871522.1 hypothetical protein IAQ61_005702 [Plenodomus lingam]CBX96422.1 similar to eukaryotic translation initiation factor 4E type 3-A [Plenodomus lingam JN3]